MLHNIFEVPIYEQDLTLLFTGSTFLQTLSFTILFNTLQSIHHICLPDTPVFVSFFPVIYLSLHAHLTLAGWFNHTFSLHLFSKTGGENEKEKLLCQDMGSTYHLPS